MAQAVIMRPDLVSGMIILNGAINLESHKDINILLFPLRSKILQQYITAVKASNPMLTNSFLRSFFYIKEASSPEIVTLLQKQLAPVEYTTAVIDWLPHLSQSPTQTLSTREVHWQNLELPIVLISGPKDTVMS